MSNDKDGDGKISKDEAPSFLQGIFDNVDTNKDGFLDKSESDAMRKNRGGGGGGGGMRDLMSMDKDGDGKVSKDEASVIPPQFFDGMDSNHDGFVDKQEADAARQRMQKGGAGTPGGGPPGQ